MTGDSSGSSFALFPSPEMHYSCIERASGTTLQGSCGVPTHATALRTCEDRDGGLRVGVDRAVPVGQPRAWYTIVPISTDNKADILNWKNIITILKIELNNIKIIVIKPIKIN